MRVYLCLALALVGSTLLAIPGAANQANAEDPAGDGAGPLAGQLDFLDIRSARLELTETDILGEIRVSGFSANAVNYPGQVHYWLEFTYREAPFRLTAAFRNQAVPPQTSGVLLALIQTNLLRLDSGVWTSLPAEVDATMNSDSVTIRASLASVSDTQGFSPTSGQSITPHTANSYWTQGPSNPHAAPSGPVSPHTDTADFAGEPLIVPGAVGNLSLATPTPTRFSNGEATTFHWLVEATNRGLERQDLELSLEAAESLDIRYPSSLAVEAGANRSFSVYVTLPFSHTHGTTRSFLLEARGQQDTARLELSVMYPTIAQPAGHHPNLYLHGSVQDGATAVPTGAWMNTLETDESANAEVIPPVEIIQCQAPSASTDGSNGVMWWFPLAPELVMGIDGRTGESGILNLQLHAGHAFPAGTAYVLLDPYSQTNATPVLDGFGDDIVEYEHTVGVPVEGTTASATIDIQAPIRLPPTLDWMPPQEGTNLALRVVYCPTDYGTYNGAYWQAFVAANALDATTGIASGARATLPLDEYHDVIDIPLADGSLSLSVDEPSRKAAPGASVLWRIRIGNLDPAKEYESRLLGLSSSLAQVLEHVKVTGGDGSTAVSIAVPEDAAPTDFLEVIYEIGERGDPASASAIRLSVDVEPSSTTNDAAAIEQLQRADRKAPAPTPAFLLLALSIATVARLAKRH